jgi:hypothetical protein
MDNFILIMIGLFVFCLMAVVGECFFGDEE